MTQNDNWIHCCGLLDNNNKVFRPVTHRHYSFHDNVYHHRWQHATTLKMGLHRSWPPLNVVLITCFLNPCLDMLPTVLSGMCDWTSLCVCACVCARVCPCVSVAGVWVYELSGEYMCVSRRVCVCVCVFWGLEHISVSGVCVSVCRCVCVYVCVCFCF